MVSLNVLSGFILHIPSILPADLKQRIRNLPKRAELHRFYQLLEEELVTALLAASTTACSAPSSAGRSESR